MDRDTFPYPRLLQSVSIQAFFLFNSLFPLPELSFKNTETPWMGGVQTGNLGDRAASLPPQPIHIFEALKRDSGMIWALWSPDTFQGFINSDFSHKKGNFGTFLGTTQEH